MKKLVMTAAIAAAGTIFATSPAMAHPDPVRAKAPAQSKNTYIKPQGRCTPLSEDTFRALKKGMTLDDIQNIVGCRGKKFVDMEVHNGTKANYVFKSGRKTVLWIWTLNGGLDTKGGNN